MKRSSRDIVRAFEEAERKTDALFLSELEPDAEDEAYQAIWREPWARLNALALVDPIEATRVFKAAPIDESIFPGEVFLAEGVIVSEDLLRELSTPDKRRRYIESWEAAMNARLQQGQGGSDDS